MRPIDDLAAKAKRRQDLPEPAIRKMLRKRARITQEEIAEAIGVSRPAVTRWENGIRTPRGAQLDAYAELLKRFTR